MLALVLALGVLQAGAAPPPQDLEALTAELRSSTWQRREAAVDGLARLGTRAAWELVVGVLDDPRGEVADAAQLRLAGIDASDPATFALLTGKTGLEARDPGVRCRAAEVLGRMGGALDARLLAGALADPEPEVRRAVLFAVQRLAARKGIAGDVEGRLAPAVERLAGGDREPLVRARALLTLEPLSPGKARERALRASDDRDPAPRCAAAALLGRLGPGDPASAALLELVADPSRAVRAAAVEGLGALGTRTAARALVERIEAEDGRPGRDVLAMLRALSGLKHPADPRPWRDWASGLPEDWRGKPLAPTAAPPEEGSAATFAGMPILSSRLAILIDLSGSMWRRRADGRTKKEVVDQELRQALEALPETTRFNLIPFTGVPLPWQERLVPATRRNVEAAARFFEQRNDQGSGNFWDASLLALADPEVDTILVLTDGEPTGGPHDALDLVVPLFLERDAFARVAVDALLVGAPPDVRRAWQDLARGSGGVTVEARLGLP